MKLKQKVPWIRKSPTGHCVWNTAVMFPFFKFACSGEFPGTLGPLPELAFAKKKALLSCYNFLQHCSQIQTPFTRHKYYLKNIVLGCPSRMLYCFDVKIKNKVKCLKLNIVKGKMGRWCHNEIILIPIGQCFFIFGWIDINKFFDLLMNQGFSSCLLICFIMFSFLAHFTL